MALRRAVPKTPLGSPIPPRSLIHKPRLLSTPSESALPQLLIPLHFKSFITIAYKKPGGGCLAFRPKFVNSSLPSFHRGVARAASLRTDRNPRNPTPFIRLLHNPDTLPQGAGTRQPRFRFSSFVFRFRVSQRAVSAAAYLPRNFSNVCNSASAMSRYFLAPLLSCFCIAACALERSVIIRCRAETMSPRSP